MARICSSVSSDSGDVITADQLVISTIQYLCRLARGSCWLPDGAAGLIASFLYRREIAHVKSPSLVAQFGSINRSFYHYLSSANFWYQSIYCDYQSSWDELNRLIKTYQVRLTPQFARRLYQGVRGRKQGWYLHAKIDLLYVFWLALGSQADARLSRFFLQHKYAIELFKSGETIYLPCDRCLLVLANSVNRLKDGGRLSLNLFRIATRGLNNKDELDRYKLAMYAVIFNQRDAFKSAVDDVFLSAKIATDHCETLNTVRDRMADLAILTVSDLICPLLFSPLSSYYSRSLIKKHDALWFDYRDVGSLLRMMLPEVRKNKRFLSPARVGELCRVRSFSGWVTLQQPDFSLEDSLYNAVAAGRYYLVDALLAAKASYDRTQWRTNFRYPSNQSSLLHIAAASQHPASKQVLERLLMAKADVDSELDGVTPLALATHPRYGNSLDKALLLLKLGADPMREVTAFMGLDSSLAKLAKRILGQWCAANTALFYLAACTCATPLPVKRVDVLLFALRYSMRRMIVDEASESGKEAIQALLDVTGSVRPRTVELGAVDVLNPVQPTADNLQREALELALERAQQRGNLRPPRMIQFVLTALLGSHQSQYLLHSHQQARVRHLREKLSKLPNDTVRAPEDLCLPLVEVLPRAPASAALELENSVIPARLKGRFFLSRFGQMKKVVERTLEAGSVVPAKITFG
jgi:hypothetical protein